MKKIILLSVFLLFSSQLWAQEPIDINGWNNTKWGMTESDLNNILKGTIVKSEQRQYLDNNTLYRELEIKDYEVNGAKFNIMFEMSSQDNKLKRVRLIYRNCLPSAFGNFEQLLISKYSQPMSNNESKSPFGGYNKTSMWLLPSTKIELIYNFAHGLGSVLNIIYSDQTVSKKETDKL